MFKQIGSTIAIQLGIAIGLGIVLGIIIGILVYDGTPASDYGILEEHTATTYNHATQEFKTQTCLVWWQSATPEGYGKILSCERIE